MSSHITRRHFVKAAAAAVAAPYILTRSARAAESAPPGDRIVMGLIGCGIQSRHLLNRFIGKPETQFVAVCDVDRTRREAARDKIEQKYRAAGEKANYKGCKIHTNYRELLADKDIEAVIIAAPDHWHTIVAIEACKAGKDIYCEKPLTLTLHEAGLMVQAVRKYNRVLQTGSQQRSDEEFHKACTLVQNGAIGDVKNVIVNIGSTSRPCDLPDQPTPEGMDWDLWLGPTPKRGYNEELAPKGADYDVYPHWREYREFSGGMMTDWGAHHFDIAQWGLGMDGKQPVEITPPKGQQGQPGYRPLTYKYDNPAGTIMTRNDQFEGKPTRGVRFIGTTGWIEVDRGYFDSSDPALKDAPEDKWNAGKVKLYKSRDHYQNFLDCIRSREKPICDVAVGASSVSVCHIGNIAWWLDKPLKWDYTKRRFNDDEANKWLDRKRREPYVLPQV